MYQLVHSPMLDTQRNLDSRLWAYGLHNLCQTKRVLDESITLEKWLHNYTKK